MPVEWYVATLSEVYDVGPLKMGLTWSLLNIKARYYCFKQ